MKLIIKTFALIFVLLLSSCGGGGGGASLYTSGSSSGTGSTSGTGATASSSSATLVLSLSSNVVNASSPGTVTALLKDATGQPIPNVVVSFSTQDGSIAAVSPSSALSGAAGTAATQLSPATGAQSGATYVIAQATAPDGSVLKTQAAVSVTAVNVTLNSVTATQSTLNAYASTALTVNVTGASTATPVTVKFSSTCTATGKAAISPTSVNLTSSSSGSVTYQDNGCNSTDTITASIAGTTQQATANIVDQAPATQGIQFVAANPPTIAIAGSGGAISSLVSFKVVDQNNNPIQGVQIDFSLDISGVATITPSSGTTDSTGTATVSVQSLLVPTPVRVKAVVHNTPSLSTVSNQLVINSGLPTQNAVSLSADKFSLDYNLDGDVANLTIRLADRFSNPVPEGTAVTFVASGATVLPSCSTGAAGSPLAGKCTVQFIVSNPRPQNGQVSVVAYAQGEESFADSNNNHAYDLGEPFTDLGQVYFDLVNFDGTATLAQVQTAAAAKPANNPTGITYIAGAVPNGVWDNNQYVRTQSKFILAVSGVQPRIYAPVSGRCDGYGAPAAFTPLTFTLSGACRVSAQICIRDANTNADQNADGVTGGNPIPSGASVSVSTLAQGANVVVDDTPIPGTATSPTLHNITASRSSCGTPPSSGGPVDLTVKMPHGQIYTFPGVGTIN